MAQPLYCWRCDRVLPMLDEEEWARMEPLLISSIENIQRYRHQHGVGLDAVPIPEMYRLALSTFQKMTGVEDIDPLALWHHRQADLGPACHHCGKPLRTPHARLCAACGKPRA
jgi:hypothetical protein